MQNVLKKKSPQPALVFATLVLFAHGGADRQPRNDAKRRAEMARQSHNVVDRHCVQAKLVGFLCQLLALRVKVVCRAMRRHKQQRHVGGRANAQLDDRMIGVADHFSKIGLEQIQILVQFVAN